MKNTSYFMYDVEMKLLLEIDDEKILT